MGNAVYILLSIFFRATFSLRGGEVSCTLNEGIPMLRVIFKRFILGV